MGGTGQQVKKIISLIAGLALQAGTACAADDQDSWTLNTYFENDLFGETDQHYTNGIRFSAVSPDLEQGFFKDPELPDWVKSYSDKLRFFHDINPRKSAQKGETLQRNVVVSLGQLMFTPTDIYATEVVEDDRPYAGYLYLGMGYHTKNSQQLDTIEINIGIVGPWAHAKETQDFVHETRNFETFKGWHNQLDNELGVQAIYEHKHRVLEKTFFSGVVAQDMIWHAGFSLGNVATYLNSGAEYRFGLSLPEDFGTAALRPGGDSSSPGLADVRRNRAGGFANPHLFVSFDARAVAHNIFLDGNTFEDSHSVDKKYFVYDVAAGFSFTYHRLKFSYAQVYRSKEFKTQQDGQQFGSMSISYTW